MQHHSRTQKKMQHSFSQLTHQIIVLVAAFIKWSTTNFSHLGFSPKSSSQQNWSTYRRELLAIYRGIKHFEDQIGYRQLTIYTDHKPIIFAFKQKLEKAEPLQREQLINISQYSTDIRHIKGDENVVADFLSRIETISQPIIDYNILSEAQEKDEETQEIIEGKSNFSITLNKLSLLDSKRELLCHI